jgi:hypothetical protein
LESLKAMAASVLREVDDWLDGLELVMSHEALAKSMQTFKTFI